LEDRTGLPVLGVVPYLSRLGLDQEDSLVIEQPQLVPFARDRINLAVILLPHLSNFTDYNVLAAESEVALRYAAMPDDTIGADVIVIPGTKTTLADMAYLQAQGFTARIADHVREGGELVGICGGYQMLGREIADPDEIETGGLAAGLGLLNLTTRLGRVKITRQVEATSLALPEMPPVPVRGYHIHMGITERGDAPACFRLDQPGSADGCSDNLGETLDQLDGARSRDGLVWGTYIHGLFDQAPFRRAWLKRARARKGLPPLSADGSDFINKVREGELDRWADHLQQHLKLDVLWDFLTRKDRTNADHEGLHQNR
jgi:adenosylcobyric acid synthase